MSWNFLFSLGPWLYCDRSFNSRVYLNWKTVETELIANWQRKFRTILTWPYSEPQMQRIGLDIGQTSRWRIKIEGKKLFQPNFINSNQHQKHFSFIVWQQALWNHKNAVSFKFSYEINGNHNTPAHAVRH